MYKCKVVSISCILLSLFYYYYYYFIDIIIFYSIWFSFWWFFRVFFLSHCCVTFCSVFFLVVLCIYSCYHLYSVLPYNLCCSLKGFLKMEKKIIIIRLVQKWLCITILGVNMQNGYNYFWLWKDSKWGEKNKKKKGVEFMYVSERSVWKRIQMAAQKIRYKCKWALAY